MTVLDSVRAALDTGWAALGDLKQSVTVRRITRGVYSPETGTTTDNVLAATVDCVLTNFQAELIDGTRHPGRRSSVHHPGQRHLRSVRAGRQRHPSTGQIWRVMRATGDLYDPPISIMNSCFAVYSHPVSCSWQTRYTTTL